MCPHCGEEGEMTGFQHSGATHPENSDSGPSSSVLDGVRHLTPTQQAVYVLLSAYPDGVCRRDFAHLADIYEVSNRIGEIEQRLGIVIDRQPCKKHPHKTRILRYRIVSSDAK